MPNKMTDNEIIKALECCIEMECSKCPMNYDDCEERDFDNLVKRAIPIFNRQKAEIERLREENKDYAYLYDKHINTAFSHIKTEAVKEFAEMLKEKAKANEWNGTICGIDIDATLKEMGVENDA